jgi:hypothetical protein
VLIYMCCDVGEVIICVEFHQRSKTMKRVGCDAQCRLNGIIQLSVVSMEDDIGPTLFVHVIGVPQHTKLHGQWFEGFGLQESGSLGQFPSDESDEYDQPAKVEIIPLILCLSTVKI